MGAGRRSRRALRSDRHSGQCGGDLVRRALSARTRDRRHSRRRSAACGSWPKRRDLRRPRRLMWTLRGWPALRDRERRPSPLRVFPLRRGWTRQRGPSRRGRWAVDGTIPRRDPRKTSQAPRFRAMRSVRRSLLAGRGTPLRAARRPTMHSRGRGMFAECPSVQPGRGMLAVHAMKMEVSQVN